MRCFGLRKAVPYTSSVPLEAIAKGFRRFEAENYLTEGYGVRLSIESRAKSQVRLGELAKIWMPNRLKGIQTSPENGIPFLVATQVFEQRPRPRKWLSPSKTPFLKQRFVQQGWILMTCSGDVGDVILSYGPMLKTIISHDLLRIQPNNPADLGYLYAFLRTRRARAMARSSKYGSVVKHVEPEHIMELPVPLFDHPLRSKLDGMIKKVFRLRQNAWELTNAAEELFSSMLGLKLPSPPSQQSFYTRSGDLIQTGRRIDAHYHNPTARAIYKSFEEAHLEIQRLGEMVGPIFGVPRFKHIYSSAGIPYVDSEDLFKVHPEVTKYIPQVAKDDAAEYFVKRGWLLMMSSGQIYGLNGSVVLADEWCESKIVSNHVTRIVAKEGEESPDMGYLLVALNHPVFGRPLVLRLAYGTEVPEIAPYDLAAMPIPRADRETEEKIGRLARDAAREWAEARSLEREAIGLADSELDRLLGVAPV